MAAERHVSSAASEEDPCYSLVNSTLQILAIPTRNVNLLLACWVDGRSHTAPFIVEHM